MTGISSRHDSFTQSQDLYQLSCKSYYHVIFESIETAQLGDRGIVMSHVNFGTIWQP